MKTSLFLITGLNYASSCGTMSGLFELRKDWNGHNTCIRLLHEEIYEYYANFHVSSDLLELRNLVLTADLIVQSALSRHESRGFHYSKDYPGTLPMAVPTVLIPNA